MVPPGFLCVEIPGIFSLQMLALPVADCGNTLRVLPLNRLPVTMDSAVC